MCGFFSFTWKPPTQLAHYIKKNKAERFICLKRSLSFLSVLLLSSFGLKPLLQAYIIYVLQKMFWNLSNKLPCSMSLNDTSFLTVGYNKKNSFLNGFFRSQDPKSKSTLLWKFSGFVFLKLHIQNTCKMGYK